MEALDTIDEGCDLYRGDLQTQEAVWTGKFKDLEKSGGNTLGRAKAGLTKEANVSRGR